LGVIDRHPFPSYEILESSHISVQGWIRQQWERLTAI
jgi:hypothetical protein